ncbi:transcriptional regulator family: Fungal Specific TF [Trichoderma aggressivum f. europaeum]|uniref:Transcriptional regulator family: Fungal Specific TF n=1 Tax=Trichoderma aggressivum f. europaeum TaxID=173218 RepID=A0AAE1M4Y6_9HYPO|nr:transcriptional regulator family: Fungal Specific TF [Trichoderma aggressivum f. europaeum]
MLQFLRNVLRRFAGPSTFTESRRSNSMLEATLRSTSHRPTEFVDNLDLSERTEFIHYYKVASNGFLNLLTDGILSQLNSETIATLELEDTSSKDDITAAYLVIAIGAHCRGNGDKDVKTSSNYFAEAQRLGFQDMLLNPSLCMVRNFILMAFYMFCACRRNTGLLYLGVASRAATILGLHLPELNATLPADIRTVRVQIWKSLRVLDLICNSILGRPSGTQDIQPEAQEARGKTELLAHTSMTLDAMFESCSVVELIAQKINRDGILDISTAEEFLQKLRGWAQGLPPTLRQLLTRDNDGCVEDNHQQVAIGNIHVACNYYFGVMLTTRQFLISEVITWLQQKQANRSDPEQSFAPSPSDAKAQELARVCTDSATYLVQMCHDAGTSDFLLGNMCILQAWVFAAGLILGLSLLRPPDITSSESNFYFSSSQNVLKRIAKLSAQAQRYAEILSDFSRAIEAYHRQLQKSSSSSNILLERILKPTPTNESGNNTTGLPSPMISHMGFSPTEEGGRPSIDLLDGMLMHEPSAIALSLQNTDDFGFDILWNDYMSTTEPQEAPLNGNFEQSSWRLNDLTSNLYQEGCGS